LKTTYFITQLQNGVQNWSVGTGLRAGAILADGPAETPAATVETLDFGYRRDDDGDGSIECGIPNGLYTKKQWRITKDHGSFFASKDSSRA